MDNSNNNAGVPTNEGVTSETTENSSEQQQTTGQIGFCHVCDRQVSIVSESFTCAECNGGFIELIENPPAQQEPQRRTLTSSFLNDGSLSSLLPLILPQLMGQSGGTNFATQRINITQDQPSNTPGQSSTRLQFIVPNSEPGGQVDLYGIMNNVLSDLLMRPSNMTSGMQQSQIHFQPPPIRMFQLHGDMRDYAWGAGGLDTIITQLLNQLENTGPPPATEQQLINLPIVKISQEEFDKKLECSICMEDFQLNEEAKKLPCKHCFHEPCISEWLKLHGTCPVCRKNLNGEDTSQREYISRPPGAEGTVVNSEETAEASSANVNTTTSQATATEQNQTSDANSTTTNSTRNPEVYHDMDFD